MEQLIRDLCSVEFRSKSKTKRLIEDYTKKVREETIRDERKRIYCYVEEMLIGSDNELLKDLSNIIFNKTKLC